VHEEHVNGRETDEVIDNGGNGPNPKDGLDKVKTEKADQAPVESANDDQNVSQSFKPVHESASLFLI